MPNNRTYGDLGESIAEKKLEKSGYKILSRNYIAEGGEIDLVGYKRGVLVFFEVKTRSGVTFGAPADSVDGAKLAHIKKAARSFCKAYENYGRIPTGTFLGRTVTRSVRQKRIDVIEVFLSRTGELRGFNHIKEAELL